MYTLIEDGKHEWKINFAQLLDEILMVFNPHMHEIFLQRYCMKWVPGDPLKEMIN